MKRFIQALLLAFAFMPALVTAQDDKIATAMVFYDQKDYLKALAKFAEGMKNPSLCSKKKLTQGHYYLAKTYADLTMASLLKGDTGLVGKVSRDYGDPIELAGINFKKAFEMDESGKLKPNINTDRSNFYNQMMFFSTKGFLVMDSINSKQPGKFPQEIFTELGSSFLSLATLEETKYDAPMYAVYSFLDGKDTVNAIKAMVMATDRYTKYKPAKPDQNIPVLFYQIANHQYTREKNADAALKTIQNGRSLFPEDENLRNLELNIYLNSPEKYEEAVKKFETALQTKPNDAGLLNAYAQLLAAKDVEKAADIYKKVLVSNPNDVIANYNLFQTYYMAAKLKFDAADAEKDYTKSDALQKEGKDLLIKGLPYMEKSIELDPKNAGLIQAAIGVYASLGNTAKATEMSSKLNALLGK